MNHYEVTGYQFDGTTVTSCIAAADVCSAVTLARHDNIIRVTRVILLDS